MTLFVRRSWIWGGALAFCALAAGVWWVASSSEETGDPVVSAAMQALDEELAKTRLYRVWKEKYPEDYQAFLRERVTKSPGGDSDSLLSRSAERMQRYLPYADNGSLIRFMTFTERQYVAIQAISPIQCALYAVGDTEFDTRLLKHIEKNDPGLSRAAMSDILADIMASNDSKRKIPSEADIATVKMKIQEPADSEGRALLQQLQETDGYDRICRASIVSSQIILKLPEDEAAGFLRYAFHAAFVARINEAGDDKP